MIKFKDKIRYQFNMSLYIASKFLHPRRAGVCSNIYKSDSFSGCCLILNDTAKLSGYTHIGCNSVMYTIYDDLIQLGFDKFIVINDYSDVKDIHHKLDGIDFVVMNGEGSIHHDSVRISRLMDVVTCCRDKKIPSVLLNATIYANSDKFIQMLNNFDIVFLRESKSYDLLRKVRGDVYLVPDLSLSEFCRYRNLDLLEKASSKLIILDSVSRSVSMNLYDFALEGNFPFFIMSTKNKTLLNNRLMAFRGVLSSQNIFKYYNLCLTGRFHGALASLCAETPVLAISSNTHKIEAVFSDIGIGSNVLSKNWLGLSSKEKIKDLDKRRYLFDEIRDKINGYISYYQSSRKKMKKMMSELI